MRKITKQVIFDLDGCLVNTEEIRYRAWKKAINNKGYSFTYEDNNNFLGRKESDVNKIVSKMFPMLCISQLRREYELNQGEIIREKGIDVKPGVQHLLKYLRKNCVKTVLATSSNKQTANMTLEHAGLKKYLDYCICGDQVDNAKPHPEIYLKAKSLCGYDDDNILVFEDSLSGIIAANRAQVDEVFVPDIGIFSTKGLNLFKQVEKISDILSYISFEKIAPQS